jgi:hypothetical protein
MSGIGPLATVVDTTAKPPAPGKTVVSMSTSSSTSQAYEAPSQPKLTVAMSVTSAEPGVKPWDSPTGARFRSKKPASRLGSISSLTTNQAQVAAKATTLPENVQLRSVAMPGKARLLISPLGFKVRKWNSRTN